MGLILVIHFHLPVPAGTAHECHGAAATIALIGHQRRTQAAFRLTLCKHNRSRLCVERLVEVSQRRQIRPGLGIRFRFGRKLRQRVALAGIGQHELDDLENVELVGRQFHGKDVGDRTGLIVAAGKRILPTEHQKAAAAIVDEIHNHVLLVLSEEGRFDAAE